MWPKKEGKNRQSINLYLMTLMGVLSPLWTVYLLIQKGRPEVGAAADQICSHIATPFYHLCFSPSSLLESESDDGVLLTTLTKMVSDVHDNVLP